MFRANTIRAQPARPVATSVDAAEAAARIPLFSRRQLLQTDVPELESLVLRLKSDVSALAVQFVADGVIAIVRVSFGP